MNLDKLNLQELSKEEMVSVIGGSWIGRVWNWIKNHLGLSSNDIPAKEGGYTDSTHGDSYLGILVQEKIV